MSTKVHTIVTGLLTAAVLALAGVLVISHQDSAAALSREAGQISQQAKLISRLQVQIASVRHLASTAAQGAGGPAQHTWGSA